MASEPLDGSLQKLLSGKVLHFRTKVSGAVLIDVRFEMIGGRQFLVGTTPPASWAGYENKLSAVAWDEVEVLYVFDTVEEWQVAHRTSQAARSQAKSQPRPWFSLW